MATFSLLSMFSMRKNVMREKELHLQGRLQDLTNIDENNIFMSKNIKIFRT
jgi:hypothetical protein